MVSANPQLRLLVTNVYGRNQQAQKVAKLLLKADADVILIQEYTPYIHTYFSSILGKTYKHRYLEARRTFWGQAIYSKYPLNNVSVTTAPLGGPQSPQMRAEVTLGKDKIVLYNIHLHWQLSTAAYLQRHALVEDWLKKEKMPSIAAGDFNFGIQSPQHSVFSDMGWIDALDVLGWGLKNTWPRNISKLYFPPLRLDHVYMSPEVRATDMKIFDIPGSDHAAILVDIQVM